MTDRAIPNDGDELRASLMIAAEFDALRPQAKPLGLRCVNPRCSTPLYLRRRQIGDDGRQLQEFVHYPSPEAERCPEARGESTTHQDMKTTLARAGEQIGLRADLEVPIGPRRADVGLYRPDLLTTDGPLMVLEAQNSPIDPADYQERDRNHWAALNSLHEPGQGDRRSAAWFFNHNPSNLANAAYLVTDRDTHSTVIGGLYPQNDLEGRPIVETAAKVLQAMRRGGVYQIIDGPLTRWVATQGQFATSPRGKRRTPTKQLPDAEGNDCNRNQPARWVGPLPKWSEGLCVECWQPVAVSASKATPVHFSCFKAREASR